MAKAKMEPPALKKTQSILETKMANRVRKNDADTEMAEFLENLRIQKRKVEIKKKQRAKAKQDSIRERMDIDMGPSPNVVNTAYGGQLSSTSAYEFSDPTNDFFGEPNEEVNHGVAGDLHRYPSTEPREAKPQLRKRAISQFDLHQHHRHDDEVAEAVTAVKQIDNSKVERLGFQTATVSRPEGELVRDGALDVEEVQSVMRGVVSRVVGGQVFEQARVKKWCHEMSAEGVKELRKIEGFKFVVTAVIVQRRKGGVGLGASAGCVWNKSTDGSVTVSWDSKTMHCVVTAFGVKM